MADRNAEVRVSEREELEEFCARVYPRLVGALAHHFGDRWLAEDLAQEAFVRTVERWPKVRHLDSPLGWTFRVGVNLGRSHLRRRAAETRARARVVEQQPADVTDAMFIRAALDELTDAQREAVILRYFLGLTVDEAAAVLDATPGAVRALTHRAVAALRLTVADEREEAPDVV